MYNIYIFSSQQPIHLKPLIYLEPAFAAARKWIARTTESLILY